MFLLLGGFVALGTGEPALPQQASSPAPSGSAGQAAPAPPATPAGSAASVSTIRRESNLVLVDTVVTDKKDHYIQDLEAKDFHVFDNGEEQKIVSFSHSSGVSAPNAPGGRRYIVLFFDDSTMSPSDQAYARKAAAQFIEKTASSDRLIAVIDFTGSFHLVQNFTDNADLLARAVKGVKIGTVNPNAPPDNTSALTAAATTSQAIPLGGASLNSVEGAFGARDLLYALSAVCKLLEPVPGRKTLILFSEGFPLDDELTSELTATIDKANKANVAIYPLDARGLFSGAPAATSSLVPLAAPGAARGSGGSDPYPHYEGLLALLMPQHGGAGGGGGGAAGGGGGARGGGGLGGAGGGGATSGGRGTGTATPGGGAGGGKGGASGSAGSSGGKGAGTTGAGTAGGGTRGGGTVTGGTRGGGGGSPALNNVNSFYGNPNFTPNANIPQFPTSATSNQDVLYALAAGTGGFPIFNTNDLAGGLDKIARELNEYYVLGYVPSGLSHDGSYHSVKVKVDAKGLEVRARNGYYDTKGVDALAGKPEAKTLEAQLAGSQPGSAHMSAEASYFYAGADDALVNVALSVPGDELNFEKDKKEFKSEVSILGAAYRPDGSVAARFSDSRSLSFDKKEMKDFNQQGFNYHTGFEIAPGQYTLKLIVSTGANSFAKQEIPLTVRPYNGNQFSISGVVLSDQFQRVQDSAVSLNEALLEDQKVFVAQNYQFQASADNRFKAGETLALYVEVYEPAMVAGKPDVQIQYEVINRKTNEQVVGNSAPVNNFGKPGNPVIAVGLPLKIENAQPGDYEVEVLATDSAGNRSPIQHASFTLN